MAKSAVQVKRISSGCYIAIVGGRTFDIDSNSGEWQLCEVVLDAAGTPNHEYWNHFATKRAAIDALSDHLAA